ncbi:MAG: hypothetical protein ABSF52_06420 [Syntrophobacteraceae bacterium]|jgi:hypothetical protein
MNLLKGSLLFGLAVVLAAGLLFILQSNADKDTTRNALPPNTCTPDDQRSGPPSIVPDNKDTTKIQYRKILFRRDKRGKAFGWAETSSVLSNSALDFHSGD